MAEENIKLFISYSWSSKNHEEWVLDLATALMESGVNVVLDKWDLKEGHDAHKFMEKMVADKSISKVVLVCDKTYVEKADERSGGVGTETQIITPEIYKKEDQDKFVAIIAERDENNQPYVPIYYKTRIFIDLSDSDLYAKNFEQLLRWIYDKPLHIKPSIGKKPAFLTETPGPSLETTALFNRTLDSIRSDKSNWVGAVTEYLGRFAQNLENFRIKMEADETDEKIVENIDHFLPYRNEAIEVFLVLAQYKNNAEAYKLLHRFFEHLLPYLERPPHITHYTDWDFDNFKFLIHELFLYCIASWLKYERFEAVGYFLRNHYFTDDANRHGSGMVSFSEFRSYIYSFESRNKRLRRLSARADLLESRSKSSGISFQQIMQADFTLYLRGCLDNMRNEGESLRWWPETLLYIRRGTSFEIYARAQSKEYFTLIAPMFGITKKEDLSELVNAFQQNKITIPRWQFESFNPLELMRYKAMATKD